MGQSSSSTSSPVSPRTSTHPNPRNRGAVWRENESENGNERYISTETTQLLTPDPEEDLEGHSARSRNENGNRSGNGRTPMIGRHDGHACFHPHAIGGICYPQDEFGDLPVYKTIHRFVSCLPFWKLMGLRIILTAMQDKEGYYLSDW